MTEKASVSLTDDQHAFARQLVKAGKFGSVSAVAQEGLNLLQAKLDAEATETAALKALLDERRRGSFVSAAEMAERVEHMINETSD